MWPTILVIKLSSSYSISLGKTFENEKKKKISGLTSYKFHQKNLFKNYNLPKGPRQSFQLYNKNLAQCLTQSR